MGGHLVRTLKKKGSFSEDFSVKKKGGHFVRLSILVQNYINPSSDIGYILRGGRLLVKMGVIQWEHDAMIFTDKYF